jgi:hypothetical protein
MSSDSFPKIIQDLLYAEQYRLLEDPVGQAMVRAFHAGVADEFVRGYVHQRVRRHKIQQAFAGPFPLPKLRHGDLVLGRDVQGHILRFPSNYLNEPTLTVASTGSGKTNRSRFMILQLADKVKGLWLFDLRKREFAVLKPYLYRIGVNLLVVPARKLRLNPLQVPDHTDPRDYAPNVSETLVRVLELPQRATKLLTVMIVHLYMKFGVLDGAKKYPTLFDLRETIAQNKSANPQARLAVVDSLDPVLMSLRDVLAYRVGWTTSDLAKRHIVFEFGGVSETDKDLVLNTLIMGEFISRISRRISNPKMDLYICCDEAARLVGKGDSSISDLIGLIRGTGIGLDLSIQSAQIVPSILSNTPNKFIGRCSSANDYKVIGAAMGLTSEQCRWLATNLVPGLFLGQLGQGRWRFPFLFTVPLLNLNGATQGTNKYVLSE